MTDDFSTAIDVSVPPSGPGCVECEATGGWWFHLRRCTKCGHVGCCDTSPSQHARGHAASSGHPMVRTYEPDEDWFYSFVTDNAYEGPELLPPLHHPLEQTVPGPEDRVPDDWQDHLN